jgi:hypothetical protein
MKGIKLKKRHKKYPCLMELTKKEEKELLYAYSKCPKDINKRKTEPWY